REGRARRRQRDRRQRRQPRRGDCRHEAIRGRAATQDHDHPALGHDCTREGGMNQPDIFGADNTDSKLVGLKVKLDRPVDRERPCCRNVCVISPGKGPHASKLTCADCGQHRGWLSQSTARWIESVMTRFGAPTTPIVLRKSFTYQEEAPPTKTNPC